MTKINPLPDDLNKIMNDIGKILADVVKPKGFALLVFDLGNDGNMNYISNANRDDMITAMKEFIAVHEGRKPDVTKLEKQ
jgi:hypothetical protein